MKTMKLLGVLLTVLLGLVVILQNTNPVEIRFLLFRTTMPNAILLALTLLVGTAIGILLALFLSAHPKKNDK